MGDTFIRHIALLGFEKRFVPSQHYVSSHPSTPALAGGQGPGPSRLPSWLPCPPRTPLLAP